LKSGFEVLSRQISALYVARWNRAHVMTSCPHTLFIHQQTARKIKEKIREATGIYVSEVPCWWGTDGESTSKWDDLKTFNKNMGSNGNNA
jgi:hypothetical protein